MKPISYKPTREDIDTILCTLSILPSLDMEITDIQAEINLQCCMSAARKITSGVQNLLPNEFRVIFASLKASQLILQGEYQVDAETKKECMNHIFTINKLVSAFESSFS